MALKRSGVLADDLEGQDDCPGVEDMDAFSLQNRLQELSSTVGFSSARGATQQSEAPQPAQTPEVNTTPRQVVAVRVGLPPVEPAVANVEAQLRAALANRAGLRQVGELLSLDTPDAGPEVEVHLVGEGREREKTDFEPIPLPGEGRSREFEALRAASPAGPQRVVSTPNLAAQNIPTAPSPSSEQNRDREETEQVRNPEDQQNISSVAPNTGAVQNPEEVRRTELLGQPDQPAGTTIAQTTLTQAGLVEAEREDQLVTRFMNGNPAPDPGPEPRVQEELGERSVPISTFA